jgi:hypothetical protein
LHNVFCEKTFVFFSSTTTLLPIFTTHCYCHGQAIQRRLAKSTLSSKEDMESELNRKLPKLDSRVPAQSASLTEEGFAPVEVQSSSAPTFDGTSNIEPQGFYPDEGYDYGARYGGYQTTRFNSTLVNDDEVDARADFRYHQHRQSAQTAGYIGAYSAPFSDPSAQSRGFRASFDDSKEESQASPALDRIEHIMERMERQQVASTFASSASSAQLHALIGQGEFHLSFSLKFWKFCRSLVFLSIERRVLSLSLHSWKVFGRPPVRWRPVPFGFRLRLEVRLVAPLCVF